MPPRWADGSPGADMGNRRRNAAGPGDRLCGRSPHAPRRRAGEDWPARYGRVAQRMLPDLDPERSRETTRIHSVLGLMPLGLARIARPALRARHHSASAAAVTGHRRSPGEVSVAHNGPLLMHEPAEFDCGALEDVAGAARDGDAVFPPPPGARHAIRYPARFQADRDPQARGGGPGSAPRASPLRAVRDGDRGGRRRRSACTDPRRVRRVGRRCPETAEPPAVGGPGLWIRPPDGPAKESARTIAALDGCGEVSRGHLEEALALARAGEGRL